MLNYTVSLLDKYTTHEKNLPQLLTLVQSTNQVFACCDLLKVGKTFNPVQMKKASKNSAICVFNNPSFKSEWESARIEPALKGHMINTDETSATVGKLSKFMTWIHDTYQLAIDKCVLNLITQRVAEVSTAASTYHATITKIKELDATTIDYTKELQQLALQLAKNGPNNPDYKDITAFGKLYELTRAHQTSALRPQFKSTDRFLNQLQQIALAEKELMRDKEFIMTRKSLKISEFLKDIKSNSRTKVADTFVAVGFEEIIWDHDVTLHGKNLYVVAPKITLLQAKVNVNLSALAPTGGSIYPGAPGVHGLDSGNLKFATTSLLTSNLSAITLSHSNTKRYFSLVLNGSSGTDGQQGQNGRDGQATDPVPVHDQFWDQAWNKYRPQKYQEWPSFFGNYNDTFSIFSSVRGNLTITSILGGVNPTTGGPGGVGGTGGSGGTAFIYVANASHNVSGSSGENAATRGK
jgi:hypothetical protein